MQAFKPDETLEPRAIKLLGYEKHNNLRRKLLPQRPSAWSSESAGSRYGHLYAKGRKRVPCPPLTPLHHHETSRRFTPPIIKKLGEAIQRSRVILELPDDWDEEGSPSYSESTWNRAAEFLFHNTSRIWRSHRLSLDIPKILQGPDGSIDLLWRTAKRDLLINLPANPDELGSFYGDDKEEGTKNAIRGTGLNISDDNEWIFLWLLK
jgi:hypothetical protein